MALSDVIKKGAGAPAPGDLIEGGIGVDTTNKKVYFKAGDASIVEVNPHGQMATDSLIGRDTAGTGVSEVLAPNAVRTILNCGRKNAIMNGDFDLWQRATTQTASSYGSDDRWFNENVGSTKVADKQVFALGQTAVPNNPTNYSRTVVTSVAAAGNYVRKVQRVEDVSTFSGETVTLSFWAKADAAKDIAISFDQNFGTGGSPSAAVNGTGNTISLTTSWAKYSVTIALPSISGKTIGTNSDDYLQLSFWFDAGSTHDTRTNTLGQQSGTFDISQGQLEKGSLATDFGLRSIGEEIVLCSRYYQLANFSLKFDDTHSTGVSIGTPLLFRNEMRVTPSTGTVTTHTLTGFNAPTPTLHSNSLGFVATTAVAVGPAAREMSGYYPLDAEL